MARLVRLQSDGVYRAGPRTTCSIPKGLIRYKNPQGDHFYKAIDRVVAEAETKAK